jgi:hypothetical protein
VSALARPPKHLSPAARRLWRETVESYELERHHLELLERACRSLDTALDAEETGRWPDPLSTFPAVIRFRPKRESAYIPFS